MAYGYICVSRALADNSIWTMERFTYGQAWVDLIMMANYADTKMILGGKVQTIKRGSFVTSKQKLAERWKWDRKTVDKYFKLLQSDGMLSVECTRNYTIVTLVNYGVYQISGYSCGQRYGQRTDNGMDNGMGNGMGNGMDNGMDNGAAQNKKDNKDNKEKKEKKEIEKKKEPAVYSTDYKLDLSIKSFIDYRKSIKKPMTERAVTLLLKKLEGLSADPDEQVAILEQSIVNGWVGVFPLKDKPKATTGDRLSWIDDI